MKFETILKYHKWYLCQISRTNQAIICLYYYPQKVCNFHMQVFQIKLKYHFSKPIKLQKFLMQKYNYQNGRPQDGWTPFWLKPFFSYIDRSVVSVNSPLLSPEGNWAELTFAKTSGTLTGDREKNWPMAARRVTSNDPRNHCGTNFRSSSLVASKFECSLAKRNA